MEGVDHRDCLLLHAGYITRLKSMRVDDVWLYFSNNLFKLFAR